MQKELVGKATGAQNWTQSGTSDKEQGVSTMKAASEQRDSAAQGYGKAEEVAGKVTGCEGMVKEGQQSERS